MCFFIMHGTVVACVVLLISRYGDKRYQLAFCVVRESHASRCLKLSRGPSVDASRFPGGSTSLHSRSMSDRASLPLRLCLTCRPTRMFVKVGAIMAKSFIKIFRIIKKLKLKVFSFLLHPPVVVVLRCHLARRPSGGTETAVPTVDSNPSPEGNGGLASGRQGGWRILTSSPHGGRLSPKSPG